MTKTTAVPLAPAVSDSMRAAVVHDLGKPLAIDDFAAEGKVHSH